MRLVYLTGGEADWSQLRVGDTVRLHSNKSRAMASIDHHIRDGGMFKVRGVDSNGSTQRAVHLGWIWSDGLQHEWWFPAEQMYEIVERGA